MSYKCALPPPPFFKPLMDNLESQTYEVFEKDPIKYSQYQQVRREHSGSAVSFVHCICIPRGGNVINLSISLGCV